MSQSGGPSAAKRVVPAKPNIYTVLAVVATVILGTGVGFVLNYSSKLTGEKNPWYVVPPTADQQSTQPASN